MFNHEDKEEQEIEAIKLIDKAEILADKGKGKEAIDLYEKAAQIYLDLGSYIKLDELYTRITQIISQFKNNIQAVYRLKSIIRKTEELKLYEISAKLLIQLGNLSFKMKDWELAGECYNQASDYLWKTDPDEFLHLVSILLLKAGQTYERSSLTKDLGKQLILKAVMKINKFDELYQQEEKKAQHLLLSKEFEAAADKFYKISTYFKQALQNLGDLLDESESKETKLNAEARFIHFVAEYQTVSAICLTATEQEKLKGKIAELGKSSIQLFQQSISLLKDYLYSKKAEFDREIILRITFDTMLLMIIQRVLNVQDIKGSEFLLKGIESNKNLVKELQKSPYFKITEKIETIGLTETLEDLLKVNLGHFETIKNTLISHFI
jgi:tetratricopeptide (TPR) repeat protein